MRKSRVDDLEAMDIDQGEVSYDVSALYIALVGQKRNAIHIWNQCCYNHKLRLILELPRGVIFTPTTTALAMQ